MSLFVRRATDETAAALASGCSAAAWQRRRSHEPHCYDTLSEWLRRWARNPLGAARRGSNPLGVAFVGNVSSRQGLGFTIARGSLLSWTRSTEAFLMSEVAGVADFVQPCSAQVGKQKKKQKAKTKKRITPPPPHLHFGCGGSQLRLEGHSRRAWHRAAPNLRNVLCQVSSSQTAWRKAGSAKGPLSKQTACPLFGAWSAK